MLDCYSLSPASCQVSSESAAAACTIHLWIYPRCNWHNNGWELWKKNLVALKKIQKRWNMLWSTSMHCKSSLTLRRKWYVIFQCLSSFWDNGMQKVGFSNVSRSDLLNLGIRRNLLIINREVLDKRLERFAVHEDRIKRLCDQIERIYRFVSVRVCECLTLTSSLFWLVKLSLNLVPEWFWMLSCWQLPRFQQTVKPSCLLPSFPKCECHWWWYQHC